MSSRTAGRRHLVSLADAADHLGTSERTIRRYVAAGKLVAYRLGPRMIRVDVAELDALLTPVGGDRS